MDMKRYLKAFKAWFIIIAILLVLVLIFRVFAPKEPEQVRENTSAPSERVYDYADVLTDEEEQFLRAYIAEKEEQVKADFVIVTMSNYMEGKEAVTNAGWRSTNWETNMMNISDDLWDSWGYGYNKNFEGDGSLLLDNRFWDEEGYSHSGEWLSTSGKVEKHLSSDDIDTILYAVDDYYYSNPCRAYQAYIDAVVKELTPVTYGVGNVIFSLVIAFIFSIMYYTTRMSQKQAQDTVGPQQYVMVNPTINRSSDTFLRKHTTSRRIESSSSSSGGGGHHYSSSGASHGGGGHRH